MKSYEPKIIVTLEPEGEAKSLHGGFCKGVYKLLDGVRSLGSLNASAKKMGMTYSKAWKIVKEAESDFDTKFLTRDGAHGSELTTDGMKLIISYEEATNSVEKATSRLKW